MDFLTNPLEWLFKTEDKKPVQQEIDKANSLATENFVPVDLSIRENAELRNSDAYNASILDKQNVAVMRVLNHTDTGEYDLSAEVRTNLLKNMDRKKAFLLLNDQKWTKDSEKMTRVKTSVRGLERVLDTRQKLDFNLFDIVEGSFKATMNNLQAYLSHNNPRTLTGVRRKRRVREMLDAVREEKKSFEKARLLYMKGFLDDKASMSPNELILFARNRAFEKKVRVDRNVKYGKDLIKGLKMEHFLAEQQEVNQALSKADEIPLCMLKVNAQFFSGDAVNSDSPIMKDMKLCADLKEQAVKLKVIDKNKTGRLLAGGVYRVKRDINGNPLNEEESKKEQANNAWSQAMKNLITAKSISTNAPTNQTAQNTLKQYQQTVLELFMKKCEEIEKNTDLWGAHNKLRDPEKLKGLIVSDIDIYNHVKFFRDCWEDFIKLCDGKDFIENYYKEHPLMKKKVETAKDLAAKLNIAIEYHMHVNVDNGVVLRDSLHTATIQQKNYPENSQEWRAAQETIVEYERGLLTHIKEDYPYYKSRCVILKKIKEADEQGKDTKDLEWLYEHADRYRDAINDVNEYKGKKVYIKVDDAVLMHILNSPGSELHEKYVVERKPIADEKARIRKAEKEGTADKGAAKKVPIPEHLKPSKVYGAFIEYIRYDSDGKLMNKEDAEKEEWNKRWLTFKDSENKEEKKNVYVEGKKRLLENKLPTPEEIRAKGIEKLIREKPYFYAQILNNYRQISKLKTEDPELHSELFEQDKAAAKYVEMIKDFSELIKACLESLHFKQSEKNEEKWVFDKAENITALRRNPPGNSFADNEGNYISEYEKAYNSFQDVKKDAEKQNA